MQTVAGTPVLQGSGPFDVYGHAFPVTHQQWACLQVPQWSRIGRLKRASFPNLGGGGHTFGGGAGAGMMSAIAGRLLCDTYLGARELLREVDYTMTTLARIHLGQSRSDLSAADVPGVQSCSHGSVPNILGSPGDTAYARPADL